MSDSEINAMPYDWTPGDVIHAESDGTIVLDDGITTYNPIRAAQWTAESAARARAETCRDYGHDFEYLQESNVTVCKHCGHQVGV